MFDDSPNGLVADLLVKTAADIRFYYFLQVDTIREIIVEESLQILPDQEVLFFKMLMVNAILTNIQECQSYELDVIFSVLML